MRRDGIKNINRAPGRGRFETTIGVGVAKIDPEDDKMIMRSSTKLAVFTGIDGFDLGPFFAQVLTKSL